MFGRIDHPEEQTQTCAKQSNEVPPWGRRPSCVPGDSLHPGATQTNAGAMIERRCCLGSVTFVISPPASTSRADERTVGEEIERGATSIAAPLRFSPADVAGQAGRTDAHTKSKRSHHNCGVSVVIFPAELTANEGRNRRGSRICTKRHFGVIASVISPVEVAAHAEKIPTTEDKLDRAPLWQRGLD